MSVRMIAALMVLGHSVMGLHTPQSGSALEQEPVSLEDPKPDDDKKEESKGDDAKKDEATGEDAKKDEAKADDVKKEAAGATCKGHGDVVSEKPDENGNCQCAKDLKCYDH